MTNEEAIKYLRQMYPHGGCCLLDELRIDAIEHAIKAIEGHDDFIAACRRVLRQRISVLEKIRPSDESAGIYYEGKRDGYAQAVELLDDSLEGLMIELEQKEPLEQ